MNYPIKNLSYIFLLSALIFSLTSCSEIFEPSITNRQVQLNAPANNYQSTSYTISFWWNEVENATKYRLQVVTPRFDSVAALVVDTLITSNKFSINLSPGSYQWKVRAENGSTRTTYSTAQSFNIVFSSIKQQKVQLGAPANNLLTNQSTLTFNWSSLYGATQYRLEIDSNNFVDESKVLYNQVLPGQQASFTLNKDHTYQWRVRAENDTAQAQWSVINNFTYDHTPPAQVQLLSPANNAGVSLPVNLQWSAVTTASKYKLYVLKSDSTTLYNNSFPMVISTTSYSLNLGTLGDRLYWKVTAVDAAGNESPVSTLRNFTLQ